MRITILLILSMLFAPLWCIAQVATAVNSRTPDVSSVLDLSNNASSRAFLPPRVSLTTLANTTSPVSNPAEGLIVYNIGTLQLPGYYIFINGSWSLMATRENSIMNGIFENKTATNVTLSTIGTFATIGGLTTLENNSDGDIAMSGGNSFTLQPGKYVISGILNIQTAETSTGAAISNGTVSTHAHYYTGRIFDGTTTVGQEIQLNAISNTSGSKKHSITFDFSFELSAAKTVSFQLARRSGGSYSSNITLNNTTLFFEKSLP